jgi:hypothetical protein
MPLCRDDGLACQPENVRSSDGDRSVTRFEQDRDRAVTAVCDRSARDGDMRRSPLKAGGQRVCDRAGRR